MRYLDYKTEEISKMLDNLQTEDGADVVYDDVLSGNEAQEIAERLGLTGRDTIVSMSLDGAQLYQNKKSDTWISIWMIHNFSPNQRYQKRHILPGTVIPGPNRPKVIDSFLFRGIHHLSALQRENNGAGLHVWDALEDAVIQSRVIFSLVMADAVGMMELDGRVGHHGAQGCRLGCPMKGQHKPNSGHYYAVHLRPNNYSVEDCNHPDVNICNLGALSFDSYQQQLAKVTASTDQADYERNRKQTGISKPSILSGLVDSLMFPLPQCFALDLMHLLFLNLGELLIPLWRGTINCAPTDDQTTWAWATLTGDLWQTHGQLVANATRFFPSFFHRPPVTQQRRFQVGTKLLSTTSIFLDLDLAYFVQCSLTYIGKTFASLYVAVRYSHSGAFLVSNFVRHILTSSSLLKSLRISLINDVLTAFTSVNPAFIHSATHVKKLCVSVQVLIQLNLLWSVLLGTLARKSANHPIHLQTLLSVHSGDPKSMHSRIYIQNWTQLQCLIFQIFLKTLERALYYCGQGIDILQQSMVQQAIPFSRQLTHPRSDDGVDFAYLMVKLHEVCGAKANEMLIRYE